MPTYAGAIVLGHSLQSSGEEMERTRQEVEREGKKLQEEEHGKERCRNVT